MTSRRARVAGAAVVLAYLAGAALSGHLNPVARRPLLDGLAPPTPYRWVSPPPDLAHMNQPPSSGSFALSLSGGRSGGGSFSTDDAQVTLIVSKGAIGPKPGATSVEISIEPLDPATLGSPPGSLEVRGNVYRISATYRPTGVRLVRPRVPIETILAYPFGVNDAGEHSLIVSATGGRWATVSSNDLVSVAQVDGSLPRFGYVAVASPKSSTTPGLGTSPAPGESVPVSIVIIGVILAILIVGLILGIRGGSWGSRGRTTPRQPPRRR